METNSTQHRMRGKDKNGRKMNPASLKNLENGKKWKPGEQGRHPGMTITQRQQQMMSEICPFDAKGRTWLEAEAEGGLRQALTMPTALSNLQDRTEGKVTQPMEVSGKLEYTDARDKLLDRINTLATVRAEEKSD